MPWKIPNDVPHENGHLHMVSTCKQEKKPQNRGIPETCVLLVPKISNNFDILIFTVLKPRF